MTLQDVKSMIESIGIPYAYYQFPEDTEQKTPFICFWYPANDDLIADNINYQKINQLVVELYTDEPDFDLETTVETVLNNHDLAYVKNAAFIDSERMWQISYTTEVVLNAE